MQSPEAAKLSAAAKAIALSYFQQRYPNADMDAFEVQVNSDKNRKTTGEVLFKEGGGSSQSVFGSERKYWPQAMMSALGLHHDGGFPFQLTPNNLTLGPIPAIDLAETIDPTQLVGELLNKKEKIYLTPTDYFTVQFRQVFKDTQITFRTAKYARRRLGGPSMGFWPQQLNFSLWCATTC